MQIVTVAPIVRGALKERLSYFSKEPLEVGMVIVVPVRTREIPAIVLETKIASDEKSTIKSSDYAIRKITRAHPRRIWTTEFLKSVEETANFSAQKFGETLLALTPKIILDAHLAGELSPAELVGRREPSRARILATQADTKTRIEYLERITRESFVRGESVCICLPTEEDVLRATDKLDRGIKEYTFSFYGSLSKKKVLERWQTAIHEKHAVLVIGTAQYLGIPRYFKTIVLDEEQSHAWNTIARPLIDQRVFVEEYARCGGSTLILGAPLLRAETYARVQSGAIEEFEHIAGRAYANIQTQIVDPRAEEKALYENTGKRALVVLSRPLHDLIQQAQKDKKSVLIIAARKGLSPITSCGDCGALVRCPECDAPLTIHKKRSGETETNIFICHSCGYMRSPEDNVHETCKSCGGWKLEGLGIGIDRIVAETSKQFPDARCFVLDGDRARTRTQIRKIIDQFNNEPGSILVATPMAIPFIDTVPYTAIVSIDSLFAIPDIRMPERIFTLILALREKTTENLLVQTRADDTTIFAQALVGELTEFTKNEIALRKIFFYPPFGTIIKITLRGKRSEVAEDMDRLAAYLHSYDPIVSGSMTKEPKNIFRMHLILKLQEKSWPSLALLEKLRALPSEMTIEVNPHNLL